MSDVYIAKLDLVKEWVDSTLNGPSNFGAYWTTLDRIRSLLKEENVSSSPMPGTVLGGVRLPFSKHQ